jgi:hypothetical protein
MGTERNCMSTDRFDLMLLALAGTPPPPPPPLPGVRHKAPPADGADPLAEAWDAEHGVLPSGWEWQP